MTVVIRCIQHTDTSYGVSWNCFSLSRWFLWLSCQPLPDKYNNQRGKFSTLPVFLYLVLITHLHLYKLQTFKWQDYLNWQRKLNDAKESAAALKAGINSMSSEVKPPESKWKAFFKRSPLKEADTVVKKNIYDKGFFHNFWEVISPISTRRSFSQTRTKSKLKAQ